MCVWMYVCTHVLLELWRADELERGVGKDAGHLVTEVVVEGLGHDASGIPVHAGLWMDGRMGMGRSMM